jgi:2-phosphosulfolactate phosphatase
MCTAFEYGVKEIIPVATIEEAIAYQKEGYLVGAERDGEIVEGFNFGNSPFSFMDEKLKGQTIVLTTTNGTKAIAIAKGVNEILIGSFLNLEALAKSLIEDDKDVLVQCAGWKNRFNLEDTIFAGALVQKLQEAENFNNLADSALASSYLYSRAEDDLYDFLSNSSHRRRLKRLNLDDDIRFCLQKSMYNVIPVFRNGVLVERNALVSTE